MCGYDREVTRTKFIVIMIQYRKSDGTLGEFDSDKLLGINVTGHTFTITLRHYFDDDYDWEDEEITDVVEIRI